MSSCALRVTELFGGGMASVAVCARFGISTMYRCAIEHAMVQTNLHGGVR